MLFLESVKRRGIPTHSGYILDSYIKEVDIMTFDDETGQRYRFIGNEILKHRIVGVHRDAVQVWFIPWSFEDAKLIRSVKYDYPSTIITEKMYPIIYNKFDINAKSYNYNLLALPLDGLPTGFYYSYYCNGIKRYYNVAHILNVLFGNKYDNIILESFVDTNGVVFQVGDKQSVIKYIRFNMPREFAGKVAMMKMAGINLLP